VRDINSAAKRTPIYIFAIIFLALIPVTLIFGSVVSDGILNAMRLCAFTIIPSLFPFFVINNFIIMSGISEHIGNLFAKPFLRLFGMNKNCASVFFTGILSGYPCAASAALKLYETGLCSLDEAKRLVAISSVAGPAFLISGIGGSLFNDRYFGLLLYIAQIAASVTSGIIQRPKKQGDAISIRNIQSDHTDHSVSSVLTSSIGNAVTSSLSVSGTVIFFGAISSVVKTALKYAPDFIGVIVCGFFEMTSGCHMAAALSSYTTSFLFCGIIVGFSGISVIMQLGSVGREIFCLKKYLFTKLISVFFCTLVSFVYSMAL